MTIRILRALAIVLLAPTIQVHAQKVERLLEFDRGEISAIHGTANVIIAGQANSVFLSKPDGSWIEAEFSTASPLTEILSVYAISPDSLLASVAYGPGFVVSTDGGLTWKSKPNVVPYPDDILYLGDSTIVGNTYQGIYKSLDFGESWHSVSSPYSQNPNATFLAHISDSVLVAGTSAGLEDYQGELFYSWDAGASWIDSSSVISSGGGPARFAAEHEGKIVLFRDHVTEVIVPVSAIVESSNSVGAPHSFTQGDDRFFGSFWRDDLELSFSDDGGTTWISTGYTTPFRARLFAPSDSIVYVSGISGSSIYLDKLSLDIAMHAEHTEEFDHATDLELFPNPARDDLTVRFNQSDPPRSASLFSIDGKAILGIQREDLNDGEVTIDTSLFPSGIYLLRVDYGFNSIYRRFVIVR